MSAANPPQSVIEVTVGPLVTGVMIEQLLLGIICSEVVSYYRYFSKDTLFNKVLVGTLFVLNLFQGAIDFHVLYRTSVLFYGNYDRFDYQSWTMWLEPAINAVIGFLAQVFFLRRVWQVTRSTIVLVLLGALVLTSVGSGLAVSIMFFKDKRFSNLALIPIPISFWLITTMAADIAIAGVLVYALLRSKTGYRKTERVVTRLIHLSMETSAATAIVAILNLLFYYVLPATAYHLLPQFSMCRVYTMTVLVTLLARTEMRSMWGSSNYTTAYSTTRHNTDNFNSRKPDNVNIHITTTQWVDGLENQEQAQLDRKDRSDIELDDRVLGQHSVKHQEQ